MFVASKIARQDVLIAVLPTLIFYVLVLAILFEDALDPGGVTSRAWGTVAAYIVLSAVFAFWLGRREQRKAQAELALT